VHCRWFWHCSYYAAQSTKDERTSKGILLLLLRVAMDLIGAIMTQNKGQFIIILRHCKHRNGKDVHQLAIFS
jgi:hypothetical protein